MAGKGDKWRKTDFKKYFDNWEKVKLSKDKTEGFIKNKGKITKKY